MHGYSGHESIVLLHYPEPFAERSLVVSGCHTRSQEVAQWFGYEHIFHPPLLTFLHAAYAPVDVGREPVTEIVLLRYRPVHIERLMAHEHSFFKTSPRESCGWLESSAAQKTSRFIDNICMSVDYSYLVFLAFRSIGYVLQRFCGV